jgi:hypothetical protein
LSATTIPIEFEFLREVDASADLHPLLERYARLPADFIRAHDGDTLPRLRSIGGPRK